MQLTITQRLSDLSQDYTVRAVTDPDRAAQLEPWSVLRNEQVYECELEHSRTGRTITLTLAQDRGAATPEPDEFLDQARRAAADVDSTWVAYDAERSFEEWCGVTDRNDDSRAEYKVWRAHCDLRSRLYAWLSYAEFTALLYETDSL